MLSSLEPTKEQISMSLLHSIFAGGAVIGLTGACLPIITALSYKDESLPDPVVRFWARNILRAADVRVQVKGLENVPKSGHFILISNHQSHFDSLVIVSYIEKHIRFVAKAELFKIPFFGSALKAAGNIKVDRSGSEKDRETLQQAIHALQTRVSIAFFPEGTRSEDGVLGPFKKGAAVLAIQAQVPILPVAVAGTVEILPKGSIRIRAGRKVALCIGAPISTTGKTLDDRDTLTQKSHEEVVRLLEEGHRLISEG